MLPLNETMGQYSELFMLLAAATYTLAFIAFAWDLARNSKTLHSWMPSTHRNSPYAAVRQMGRQRVQ